MNEPNKKDSNPRFFNISEFRGIFEKNNLRYAFFICRLVYKVLKAVLFNILSNIKQSGFFVFLEVNLKKRLNIFMEEFIKRMIRTAVRAKAIL